MSMRETMIREHVEAESGFDPDCDSIESVILTSRDGLKETYIVVVTCQDNPPSVNTTVELLRVTMVTYTNPSATVIDATRVYLS